MNESRRLHDIVSNYEATWELREPQGTPSTGDQGEVDHVATTTGVPID